MCAMSRFVAVHSDSDHATHAECQDALRVKDDMFPERSGKSAMRCGCRRSEFQVAVVIDATPSCAALNILIAMPGHYLPYDGVISDAHRRSLARYDDSDAETSDDSEALIARSFSMRRGRSPSPPRAPPLLDNAVWVDGEEPQRHRCCICTELVKQCMLFDCGEQHAMCRRCSCTSKMLISVPNLIESNLLHAICFDHAFREIGGGVDHIHRCGAGRCVREMPSVQGGSANCRPATIGAVDTRSCSIRKSFSLDRP